MMPYAETILESIDEEHRLPRKIPDKMWEVIKSAVASDDRALATKMLRIAVQATKESISHQLERLLSHPNFCRTRKHQVLYGLFEMTDHVGRELGFEDICSHCSHISQSVIYKHLRDLIAEGMVTKEKGPDFDTGAHLITIYRLTQKGLELGDALHEARFDQEPIVESQPRPRRKQQEILI